MGKDEGAETSQGAAAPGCAADRAELAKFGALAAASWDPHGPMRPLHLMNPIRLEFVLKQLGGVERPGRRRRLAGLRVLDVGCGAGLLAEPLARLGAEVTGVDAAEPMIDTARAHASANELAIDYRVGTAEDLIGKLLPFDLVTALEIVEHVPDRHAFVSSLGQLARPGGTVVLSTLSRTLRSLFLAVGAAEYLLGWLPRGTHDWRRFVRPAELAANLRDAGLRPTDLAGVAYEPAYQRFRITRDPGVNYLIAAVREG
jgi:2-polyprenyl-6-hydroxyphenyl methylase/3-demethylubiquinone-9 3-methyltransferase